jgi:membrane-associated phospholipid phosphatase
LTQELAETQGNRIAALPEISLPGQNEGRSTPIRKRLLREVLLVGLGYFVYSQVRGLAGGRTSDAFANAERIIDLERTLGIYSELTIQRWVLPNATLIDVFNLLYFYMFFPLIIPIAAWLFWKHPEVYALARTAFLASGAIAVCFFLTLPTAPPRLLDAGFVDTLNLSLTPTYSDIPGVNHYAALPSMHVGWTFLLAVAITWALPRWRWRGFAFVIPLLMFSSTVVTGNHWFVDGALGLVVALAGLWASLRIRQWIQARRQETLPASG